MPPIPSGLVPFGAVQRASGLRDAAVRDPAEDDAPADRASFTESLGVAIRQRRADDDVQRSHGLGERATSIDAAHGSAARRRPTRAHDVPDDAAADEANAGSPAAGATTPTPPVAIQDDAVASSDATGDSSVTPAVGAIDAAAEANPVLADRPATPPQPAGPAKVGQDAAGTAPAPDPAAAAVSQASATVSQARARRGDGSGAPALRGASATPATPTTPATPAAPAAPAAPSPSSDEPWSAGRAPRATAATPATPAVPAVPGASATPPPATPATAATPAAAAPDQGPATTISGDIVPSSPPDASSQAKPSGRDEIAGGTVPVNPTEVAPAQAGQATEPSAGTLGPRDRADRADRADETRERPSGGNRASGDSQPGVASAGHSQRLDAAVSAGRPVDTSTATEQPGPVVAGITTEAAVADVQRLLDRVVGRIRTVGTRADPALEARLQDPEFGSVRVLVAGRTGEIVRAELFVADQRTADALTRAVDRTSTSHGLAGIDLRIRTEPARADAGTPGSGTGSDDGRPNPDQRGWAGTQGGLDRGLGQGRRDTANDTSGSRARKPVLPVPAIAVLRRHAPVTGSLDVRA